MCVKFEMSEREKRKSIFVCGPLKKAAREKRFFRAVLFKSTARDNEEYHVRRQPGASPLFSRAISVTVHQKTKGPVTQENLLLRACVRASGHWILA